MATVKIVPIHLKTTGGHDAIVVGIQPFDSTADIFVGTLTSDAMGTVQSRWNVTGVCRGQAASANIDTGQPEFVELKRLALSLGAKP